MLAGVSLAMLAGSGCETPAPSNPSASAPAIAPDVERSPPAIASKAVIDELLTELASVLRRRLDLGRTLLDAPEAFTRTDAERASRCYYEEATILARIESMLETSPERLRTVCKSFELRVQGLEIRELDLWSDIRDAPTCGPSAAMRIYGDEYTAREREWERGVYQAIFARGLGAYYADHPERREQDDGLTFASDLATLCLRARIFEESFDEYRGEAM